MHIKEDIEGLTGKHVDIVRVREKMNPFSGNSQKEKGAMFDKNLALSILVIDEALGKLSAAPTGFGVLDDFIGTPAGMEN